MAKIEVHKLASELQRSNKEVLDVLQKNGVHVQSPFSVVTEDQARDVRRFFNPEPEPEPEPEKKEEPAKAAAPKKRITAVFRSQNSSQAGSRPRSGSTQAQGRFKKPAARPGTQGGTAESAQTGERSSQSRTQTGERSAASRTQSGERSGQSRTQSGERSSQGRTQSGERSSQSGERSAQRRLRPARTENGEAEKTARPARTGEPRQRRSSEGTGTERQTSRNTESRRPAEGRTGEPRQRRSSEGTGGERQASGGERRYQSRDGGSRRTGTEGGYSQSRSAEGTSRDSQSRRSTSGHRDSRDTRRDSYNSSNMSGQGKPSARQKQKQQGKNVHYDKGQIGDEMEMKGAKRGGKSVKPPAKPQGADKAKEEVIKTIVLPEVITIKELADKMKQQPAAIVKKLFLAGKVYTINQEIDYDTAEEIAMDFDILCEKEVKVDVIEELLKETEDPAETLQPRPPVVCVMGHVDHGKTSLLDTIRKTNVTEKETGGITQRIGASVVEINGQHITFIDTPGHEAFTAMRMRGAQATDIAILVVAADDGVMPQTIEAINHAKAAGVEIIVAINKIDKPGANVDRVKQEVAEQGLVPEDWGGGTIFVPVSAKTGEGIDNLLEMILLTAEVKELRANPDRRARGMVIEAELDKGRGPVATVLVQKGTLHVGDSIAAGACYGKVRAMIDDKGRRVKEAGPSTPVEIQGLNDVPDAGEIFVSPDSEKAARSFAETFISEGRQKLIDETKGKLSLDDLFDQIKAGNVKELNIIIKADVQGSVEAVKQSLLKLSNDEVVVKIIHGGVGAINESDVTLASASNAIIIGFNVRPDAQARSVAEQEHVDVRLYKVIYQAIEDVEAAMKGMLDPIFEEQVIGHAIVRQTFRASGVGVIAGAYVTDGRLQRDCKIRVTRQGDQIYEGQIVSLRRFKDDVKEVQKGYECGFVADEFGDFQEDDSVEAYIMVEAPR